MIIEKPHWSMWIHHLAALYGSSAMLFLYRDQSWSLSLFTVSTTLIQLSEVSALTNNIVWYAQTLGPRYSVTVCYLSLLRLAAFALVRIPLTPFTAWWAVEKCGGLHGIFQQLIKTPWLSIQTSGMIALFGLLNVVWTAAMWKSSMRIRKRVYNLAEKKE
jgi:hypothetical protein